MSYVSGQDPKDRRNTYELLRRLGDIDALLAEVTSSASPVDHGALTGLGDDDHTQYARSDGSRGNFEVVGAAASALASAQGYADDADDVHSAADRAYADGEDDAHSTADRAYADAAVATHAAVAVDAHEATAVGFTPPGGLSAAWLTSDDVQNGMVQIAAQTYAPDAEQTDALIGALNSLATAEITNGDVFASNLIAARHLAAGSVTAGKIDALAVTAGTIAAGAVNGTHVSASSTITIGTHATNKWIIAGTSSAATTVIRTASATSYGVAGVWMDASGRFSLGTSKLLFDGSSLNIQAAISASAFVLMDGSVEVGRLYSDDTNYNRLRMETNNTTYPNEAWDMVWNSNDNTAFGRQVMYLGYKLPTNPTEAQMDVAHGLQLKFDDFNSSATLTAGDASVAVTTPGTVILNAGIGGSTLTVNVFGTSVSTDLDVGGHATIDGKLLASDGGAASPSIAFDGDTDTGFSRPFANGIDVSAGGSAVWRWGGSTNHSYQKLWMNGNLIHLGGGALSDVGNSNFVGYIQMGSNAITQVGYLRVNEGSTTIPSVANQSDTDTGINFRSGGGIVDVVINGSIMGAWDATGVFFQKAYDSTTGNAASVFVNSNGRLYRSTSAKKYKDKIKPLTLAEAQKVVFGVEAVSYQSKCKDDDGRKRHVGIVADPMADIDKRFVTFGDDGDVEGFVYERMPAPLSVVACDHEARIAALEATVAKLAKELKL